MNLIIHICIKNIKLFDANTGCTSILRLYTVFQPLMAGLVFQTSHDCSLRTFPIPFSWSAIHFPFDNSQCSFM